jgi:hypothetical protein
MPARTVPRNVTTRETAAESETWSDGIPLGTDRDAAERIVAGTARSIGTKWSTPSEPSKGPYRDTLPPARVRPQRARHNEEDAMVIQHRHQPGRFDPGHCRGCAHEADLLDHYWQVQREELAFKEAHRWARRAHRQATWALWSCWVGMLLAVIAVVTG